MNRKARASLVTASVALCALAVALPSQASASTHKTVIRVAYGSTYVFDTTGLATRWWHSLAKQFDKAHPNAEVKLVPIPGTYNNIVTKLSLMYRSSSTAPDVAQVPTAQIGEWVSSGYLQALNQRLQGETWWNSIPKVVQSEGEFGGKYYAVNMGENTFALMYNKKMLKHAGVNVPWHPKNWNDIYTAAEKVHKTYPSVTALWLLAGTGSGTNGILQGAGNLINGSVTPTIYDSAKDGWVTDSPGLRAVFKFYKTIYSAGLGASTSQLFSPNAVTVPLAAFKKGKLAIAIAGNYYGGNWTKAVCAPCWSGANKVIGVTPIPTQNGQSPGAASTLGGWDLVMSAASKHQQLAWDFIKLAEQKENLVSAANGAGFVPPTKASQIAASYVQFAPPYNAIFASILPDATITPSQSAYTIWGQGFNEATGAIARNPNTSVNRAIHILTSYVSNQLGSNKAITLK